MNVLGLQWPWIPSGEGDGDSSDSLEAAREAEAEEHTHEWSSLTLLFCDAI